MTYFLFNVLHHDHVLYKKASEQKSALVRTNLLFTLFEDIPQFWLQTENNMLIGRSLSFFEIAAPLTGFVSATFSILGYLFHSLEKKIPTCEFIKVTFFTGILQALVISIVLRFCYETGNDLQFENLPDWASNMTYNTNANIEINAPVYTHRKIGGLLCSQAQGSSLNVYDLTLDECTEHCYREPNCQSF